MVAAFLPKGFGVTQHGSDDFAIEPSEDRAPCVGSVNGRLPEIETPPQTGTPTETKMFLITDGTVEAITKAMVVVDEATLPFAIEAFIKATDCDPDMVCVNPVGAALGTLPVLQHFTCLPQSGTPTESKNALRRRTPDLLAVWY